MIHWILYVFGVYFFTLEWLCVLSSPGADCAAKVGFDGSAWSAHAHGSKIVCKPNFVMKDRSQNWHEQFSLHLILCADCRQTLWCPRQSSYDLPEGGFTAQSSQLRYYVCRAVREREKMLTGHCQRQSTLARTRLKRWTVSVSQVLGIISVPSVAPSVCLSFRLYLRLYLSLSCVRACTLALYAF